MSNEYTATVGFLRQKLPSLKSMYDHLENKGWFLPPYQNRSKKSKVWSQKYLLRLLEGAAFRIHRNEIKIPKTLKQVVKKYELVELINKKVRPKLNFDTHYPNKQWLTYVLYSVDPENEIFQDPGTNYDKFQMTISKE